MTFDAPRRVVTGHDDAGVSTVVEDGPAPVVRQIPQAGVTFTEMWLTGASPAPVTAQEADPTAGAVQLAPPTGGTLIRYTDFEPGHVVEGGRQSRWHRTETVDYGIVVFGEVVLMLEDREVVLGPGDVIVQRGTNHAWANRGDVPARVAFVLVDGTFDPALAEKIGDEATAEAAAERRDAVTPPTP